MRIEKLGPWLRPALLAPWLSMAACVTISTPLLFIFGLPDPLLGGPISHWVIVMVAGSYASGLVSSALIVVDLVRAKFGKHPPIGIRAWVRGVLAFAIPVGLYILLMSWVIQPHYDDPELFSIHSSTNVPLDIRDADPKDNRARTTTFTFEINNLNTNITSIGKIDLHIVIDDGRPVTGDLSAVLMCPSGNFRRLMSDHELSIGFAEMELFYGERPHGIWTLEITDSMNNSPHQLTSWSMKVWDQEDVPPIIEYKPR